MNHEEKPARSRPWSNEQRREESRLPRGERGTPSTVGESTGTALALTEKDIVRFWSKVDKNGPLPDQSNPHYAGLDRCWVWTAGKFNNGYGQFKVNGRPCSTHRVAWEIANKLPVPKHKGIHKTVVMHLCDQRDCTNPSHLRIGSHIDNVDDKVSKCRQAKGDTSGARLHPERMPRGDKNGSRTKPERLARGDKNGSRLHPERVPRGETSGLAKLNTEQVIVIRRRYAAGGITQEALGLMFGVHKNAIGAIVRREVWTHVPPTTQDWI